MRSDPSPSDDRTVPGPPIPRTKSLRPLRDWIRFGFQSCSDPERAALHDTRRWLRSGDLPTRSTGRSCCRRAVALRPQQSPGLQPCPVAAALHLLGCDPQVRCHFGHGVPLKVSQLEHLPLAWRQGSFERLEHLHPTRRFPSREGTPSPCRSGTATRQVWRIPPLRQTTRLSPPWQSFARSGSGRESASRLIVLGFRSQV